MADLKYFKVSLTTGTVTAKKKKHFVNKDAENNHKN